MPVLKKYICLIFVLLLITNCFDVTFCKDELHGRYEGDNKDYREVLYFYDNKFIYYFNLGEGMAMVEGNYLLESNIIKCNIMKRNFKGWPEEKVDKLFIKREGEKLKFITPYGYDVSDTKYFSQNPSLEKKVIASILRIRSTPSITGEIIADVKKGDLLHEIAVVREDVINNINGYWVFVEYEDRKFGYCFDAYLTK